MGGIMSRLEVKQLQQVVALLNPISELASDGSLFWNILRRQRELEELSARRCARS